MNIMELLKKALEDGTITQEEYDNQVLELGSKKFSQEDIDNAVKNRVEREKKKYEKQIQDLQNKEPETDLTEVEELKKQLETLSQTVTGYQSKEKERTIQSKIQEKIKALNLCRDIPKPYLNMIQGTEDDVELDKNIQDVVNQFKTDFPTDFGSGANPSGEVKDLNKMSASQLFEIGLQK